MNVLQYCFTSPYLHDERRIMTPDQIFHELERSSLIKDNGSTVAWRHHFTGEDAQGSGRPADLSWLGHFTSLSRPTQYYEVTLKMSNS